MRVINPQLLHRERSVLFVCDIQEKLWTTMHPDLQPGILKNVPILLQAAHRLEIPIVVTEQYPTGLGKTISELAEHVGEAPVFEKVHFAATEDDQFYPAMEKIGRQQIVLCGIETHICVYQSALGLAHIGFDVHLVQDGCASRTEENHETGLGLIATAGALLTSTETVLFQWLERAGTPEFKELQKLIM